MERTRGFTLVEMIVVIVLTGIVAGAVAVFIQNPVRGYIDAARRAELTDIADTALRRIGRDLRLALPNSVRTTDGGQTIEFLITRTGSRYRAEKRADGSGDPLDFQASDTSFDVIGPPITMASGDRIAVYNLGTGVTGANAYAGDNIVAYTGAAGGVSKITISSFLFPFASPGNRFQVVEGPVSYACSGGVLSRYWGYGIQSTQPGVAVLPGLAGAQGTAQLAGNVGVCAFSYVQGATERGGLILMQLTLTSDGQNVTLLHEVHVSNVP